MKSTNKEARIYKGNPQFRMNIGTNEVSTAIIDLDPNAFKLYMHYHTKGDGWIFKPSDIAKATGTSVRTMQYAKKELIDKQYLFIDHEKRQDAYYLGPKIVKAFKKKWGIDYD